jgi:hypothetical protein
VKNDFATSASMLLFLFCFDISMDSHGDTSSGAMEFGVNKQINSVVLRKGLQNVVRLPPTSFGDGLARKYVSPYNATYSTIHRAVRNVLNPRIN